MELSISTKDEKYSKRLNELLPVIEKQFVFHAGYAVKALPFMDENFRNKIEELTLKQKEQLNKFYLQNPCGVPITTGGWAGSGRVIQFANTNYLLHKAFPKIIDAEFTPSGLNYIYGSHPGSNVSLVSGVGTHSKSIAYGNNRADFSFIAGGIVPGVLILKSNFPENKEDWPFLWGENECVVN